MPPIAITPPPANASMNHPAPPPASSLLPSVAGPAVLSYGFRPFFLLAGAWAAAALAIWIPAFLGYAGLPSLFDPLSWHAHEMLFGFAAAAVAGFVLTATPNWTGRPPVRGQPLLLLVLLWVAGRIAVALSAMIGGWAAAVIDVGFLAVLAGVVALEIRAGRNWRNAPIVALIAVLAAANALFHAQALSAAPTLPASRLAVAVLIVLICLIGGRIIPSFTRNWLIKRGGQRLPAEPGRTDMAVLLITVIAAALWTYDPQSILTAAAAASAAAANAVRLARWSGRHTAAEPLVWILHVAYLWIPVGFALVAMSALAPGVAPSAGIHALTGGAITAMIVAVMTRATLGHTGRQLHAGAATTAVYVLVLIAGISRVAAAFVAAAFLPLMMLSAAAWVAAFAIFLAVYGPMLAGPRVQPTA